MSDSGTEVELLNVVGSLLRPELEILIARLQIPTNVLSNRTPVERALDVLRYWKKSQNDPSKLLYELSQLRPHLIIKSKPNLVDNIPIPPQDENPKPLHVDDQYIIHRMKAVQGDWKGTADVDLDSEQNFDLRCNFQAAKNSITGTVKYTDSQSDPVELSLKGYFFNQQYIYFSYSNKDIAILQFGFIVFRLSANTKLLNGRYTGYGAENDRIVSGNLELKKIPG